jgi:septal ring factor EnvC (AmiA/AmiB activator)
MGVARENRYKAKSLRDFHAETLRRPGDERTHLANRLAAAEATITDLRAALARSESAEIAAEQRVAVAEAATVKAERDAALWKRFAMRWRRQVEPLAASRLKLSTIIRWGLSPSRYQELSADYDREGGNG